MALVGGHKTCKFFSELDEILGCRPASVPSVLLESCSTLDLQSVGDAEDGDGNANGNIYTVLLVIFKVCCQSFPYIFCTSMQGITIIIYSVNAACVDILEPFLIKPFSVNLTQVVKHATSHN